MSRPISLSEMLAAREERGAFRRRFFQDVPPGTSLIQFTVNIPGNIKNSPIIRDIFLEGLRCFAEEFPGSSLLSPSSPDRVTGPEGFIVMTGEGEGIKRRTCRLEEECSLGRLWDIDVFTGPELSISRSVLLLEERRCLLCSRPSHECARSRRHNLADLLVHIDKICRNYFVKESGSGLR